MSRYLGRMFIIVLTGFAAELFLPLAAGGTSYGGMQTGNPGLGSRLLHSQVAVIMPIYDLAESKWMKKQQEDKTIKLLSMADLETQDTFPQADVETISEEVVFRVPAEDPIPRERVYELEMDRYGTYEELVKEFYTIDGNTIAGKDQLNIEKLLDKDMSLTAEEGDLPQILIYHTHSQEAYADSIPGDAASTVVGVGEQLAQILREKYGYQVLHCTEQFDVENREQAYAKALPALQKILEENPSVQVMIDLHRDEMPESTRLVTEVDGKPTARFMFFNGLSRTKKTGDISYLKNENIDGNLAFSFQMQIKCMEYYPGLTRKIYLKGYRYNLHLKERALLVELGAQNNTVEEAMNACGPLAHALHLVLSGEKEGFSTE